IHLVATRPQRAIDPSRRGHGAAGCHRTLAEHNRRLLEDASWSVASSGRVTSAERLSSIAGAMVERAPAAPATSGIPHRAAHRSRSRRIAMLRQKARSALAAWIQDLLDGPANQAFLAEFPDTQALARRLFAEAILVAYRLLFRLKIDCGAIAPGV